ncbi:hypothetical protein GCK72_010294 [Caenorhabditis remanei]|uniref:Uncharacterized protein n=1 Tax=Caenorhabditis remanei TaxID=31234 RepID=A0A2P4V9U2_CAERE|nr:hypothetical protein GCK72_010294 [Caenorhabditis remanei]KAF1762033.1 hypothetical protein GCK72_010294 [Caenorhabditis remanei]
MLSRNRFGEYAVRDRHTKIVKMIISFFMLLARLDPTIAISVRRSLNTYHPNLDAEPYGIIPPTYPYDPHPLSTPESIVQSPRPIHCNNQTEYECVCMKPYSSPHSPAQTIFAAPDCSVFIKTDDLPVVDMRMRQVNTEAKLYTGDSYEEYFKRRISTIVSHYCQHNANECPGVSLRMSHEMLQILSDQEADELDLDKSVVYAERDESEPLFTKDNVVILRMDHLRGNLTRLLFILTKNDRNNGIINEDTIIDPVKIKYIIASQVGPLSRVLGGIKIDSVRTAKLKRNPALGSISYSTPEQRRENVKGNTKLILIVSGIVSFFGITYCIAIYQCIKWYLNKSKAAKEATQAEQSLVAADTKNYGTCEIKHRKPSRNGHMVHSEERTPLTYEQIDEVPDDNSQSLSQRQMRNWFKCDASQLPREPTCPTSLVESYQQTPAASNTTPNPTNDFKVKEESPILTKSKDEKESRKPVSPMLSSQATTSSEAVFPPSKDFSDYVEDQYHKSRASSNSPTEELQKSLNEDPWDDLNGKYVPPVVLLQSDTPDLPLTIQNHLGKQKSDNDDVAVKGLRSSESPSFARPRSRRGSRIDEMEGQLDLAELKPLQTDDPLAEPIDAPVPINSIKGSVDEEDRWSSSEEGEVDVYYKMSDDEDVTREELDWKKAMAKAELEKEAESQGRTLPGSENVEINKKRTETPPSSPIQIHIQNHLNHNNDSDSEEEDEPIPEEAKDAEIAEKDDDFVYERLREELSPQPPIVVDLDTTDLDLVPIKSLPPPPPGMFPDSPPESGSGSNQLHHQRSQEMSEDEDDLR